MDRETAQRLLAKTPEYIAAPCPWCKATTIEEASVKCRPSQMPCGDYTCGTPEEAPETDGFLHQRNPEFDRLSGYLWGWHAVDEGLTKTPPGWPDGGVDAGR